MITKMNEFSSDKNTFEKIYNVVKKIPKGMVSNYGTIALLAGNSRWSRVVGYALHVNPNPALIPCHRVVTKNGSLSPAFAFGGENQQRKLLENEGIIFDCDGKVNMDLHYWNGLTKLF